MTEAPRVLYEQSGAVVTLTLNRPDELNAFSEPAMIEAFLAALARIKTDGTARAVVLTGAGKAFSAGGNVKHMRDKPICSQARLRISNAPMPTAFIRCRWR